MFVFRLLAGRLLPLFLRTHRERLIQLGGRRVAQSLLEFLAALLGRLELQQGRLELLEGRLESTLLRCE